MGPVGGPRSGRLRDALAASDKGDPDSKRTKNIRAIQILLGHTNLESAIRYLGIEVDDALEISKQTEI